MKRKEKKQLQQHKKRDNWKLFLSFVLSMIWYTNWTVPTQGKKALDKSPQRGPKLAKLVWHCTKTHHDAFPHDHTC